MTSFFSASPAVVALLRRDVPRPATLPERIEGCPRWNAGDTPYTGLDLDHLRTFKCAMGLHPEAKSTCPYYGLGWMLPGRPFGTEAEETAAVEFPAPHREVLAFGKNFDNLTPEQYPAAMDEIWPQEEHND
jgi:hypothetical protein